MHQFSAVFRVVPTTINQTIRQVKANAWPKRGSLPEPTLDGSTAFNSQIY